MMHATPLFESQIESISYEYSYAPCAPISCDYCDAFDHDVDTCPLFGRPHRLEALAALNREIYFRSLLQTDLRSCDDFGGRSEASITFGHDYFDNTPSDDLKALSDPSYPLVVKSTLDFKTVSDHPEGNLTIHDSSFPLAPS